MVTVEVVMTVSVTVVIGGHAAVVARSGGYNVATSVVTCVYRYTHVVLLLELGQVGHADSAGRPKVNIILTSQLFWNRGKKIYTPVQ